MIDADAEAGFRALAERLATRAQALAGARMAVRRDGARAWRSARRLWPLFTKG